MWTDPIYRKSEPEEVHLAYDVYVRIGCGMRRIATIASQMVMPAFAYYNERYHQVEIIDTTTGELVMMSVQA